MRDKKVYEIVVIAVFTALIIVLTIVPQIGYIQLFGIVGITIIHIPVLIGGIFGGRKVAVSLGLVFGLSSLFVALTRPASPVDFVFQNPLVSVLPRVLFGLAMYEIYRLFRKVIKVKYLDMTLTMIVSTFVHTLLVLVPLFIFGRNALAEVGFTGSMFTLIIGVILTNGIMEIVLAGVIGGPIAQRLLDYKEADL